MDWVQEGFLARVRMGEDMLDPVDEMMILE